MYVRTRANNLHLHVHLNNRINHNTTTRYVIYLRWWAWIYNQRHSQLLLFTTIYSSTI